MRPLAVTSPYNSANNFGPIIVTSNAQVGHDINLTSRAR